jgi:hypothetical protein
MRGLHGVSTAATGVVGRKSPSSASPALGTFSPPSRGEGKIAAATDIAAVSRRLRLRAIWAWTFFASAVPAIIVGQGFIGTSERLRDVAAIMALIFWLFGMIPAVAATITAFRHWDALPDRIRLLAVSPLLAVSFSFSLGVLSVVLA